MAPGAYFHKLYNTCKTTYTHEVHAVIPVRRTSLTTKKAGHADSGHFRFPCEPADKNGKNQLISSIGALHTCQAS